MTKVELFHEELQETARIFKVLSHPARLAIIKYLAETKVCISGDITDQLPLSRTTIIQHLAELKKFGIIKGEIDGIKTKYCLNPQKIVAVKQVIDTFFDMADKSIDNNC